MSELYDILTNLYEKKKDIPEINDGFSIVVNKWLSWDSINVPYLKRTIKYLFYVEPIHYYYLLFFHLPKRKFKFIKNRDPKKEDETELIKKIQYVFGWSTNELNKNRRILEQTILKKSNYWKQELGLETEE